MNLKTKAFVVHLDLSEDILVSRALERGDNLDEVKRRIRTDREPFKIMKELRPPDMRVVRGLPVVTTVDYILMKQEALSRNLHAL